MRKGITAEEYCLHNNKAAVLAEYDVENNRFPLDQLGFASHQKINWICSKGHRWQCMLKERLVHDNGCPYCSNRKVLKGYNDLATQKPQILKEWNYEKNLNIAPDEVTVGSMKKVWWKCELGHGWEATIENRALKEHQCPFCSGKKAWPGYNDLFTLFPKLEKEWDYEKNGAIDPTKLRPGAGLRVWWKCQSGHSWQTYLFSRTSSKKPGCPFCSGRVKNVNEREVPK